MTTKTATLPNQLASRLVTIAGRETRVIVASRDTLAIASYPAYLNNKGWDMPQLADVIRACRWTVALPLATIRARMFASYDAATRNMHTSNADRAARLACLATGMTPSEAEAQVNAWRVEHYAQANAAAIEAHQAARAAALVRADDFQVTYTPGEKNGMQGMRATLTDAAGITYTGGTWMTFEAQRWALHDALRQVPEIGSAHAQAAAEYVRQAPPANLSRDPAQLPPITPASLNADDAAEHASLANDYRYGPGLTVDQMRRLRELNERADALDTAELLAAKTV